jgi:O-methyltransferase
MNSFKKTISIYLNMILKYFNLRLVFNNDHIFNHDNFELNNLKVSKLYSMTGEKRMSYLTKCIKFIYENNIKGDFVECGVWKGGNLILMQQLNDHFKLNKKIYGYDTFEGMTQPNEFDIDKDNKKASTLFVSEKKIENLNSPNVWCYSGLDTVKNNFEKNTLNNDLILIKGDVCETLKVDKNIPESISLLRLDTDFYDSTKAELEILFPLVVKNGLIVIDDYGHWQGQRKAVDEFLKKTNISPFMFEVDYSCRIFQKN